MRVLSRQVIARHEPGRAPLCACVTYIDSKKPVILRRTGFEISNDIHDDFTDTISRDNGRTWEKPVPAPSSIKVDGGVIVHTEHAALHLPDRNLLIIWTNDKFEASLTGGNDFDHSASIRITTGEPSAVIDGSAPNPFISDYGFKQGIYVSFATPLVHSSGRILIPVMWQREFVTPPSRPIASSDRVAGVKAFTTRKDMPNVFADVWHDAVLIGDFQRDGTLKWHVSKPVPYDFNDTSRGLHEGTLAELAGGRLVQVIRGSNEFWPEAPGYKWVSYSDDRGETWSSVVPLTGDDGEPIESSGTGSGLFRSIKNGKLYWIGNLCLDGRRPAGNMPRSPFYIAEMQANPFAIKRSTITPIDQAREAEGEHPETQHSNFKFYQDRETGDVVIYLTRYGERGYADGKWMEADLYEYRVAVP